MADLLAAQLQRDNGVTQNTRDKEVRVWRRWQEYTRLINYEHDIWLTYLTPSERTTIMGAFAAALRRRQFSRPDKKDLAAATVQETLGKLGEIFRANVGYDPTHGDGSGGFHPALARQFKGMRNADPGEQQQKALPVCVYREIHRVAAASKNSLSDLDVAVADILTLAFFFCMRSCEYADVQGERRTKILCVRNLRFYDRLNRNISNDVDNLHSATTISITFEFQKKEVRNDTISHQKSSDTMGKGEMCPVRAAADIVMRLRSYNIPGNAFQDTPINFVKSGASYYTIPGTMFLSKIRAAVASLGHEKLGFNPEDVGTHSNRSGGAMGMFLAGTPIYTIMLMGRWSSDAFMRYIRKQVLQLSHGIAAKMLTYEEFYTVPDFVHTAADGDPRGRNNSSLATTQGFNGSHANMRRGLHPAFHLSH
jgi:hypothetical protein